MKANFKEKLDSQSDLERALFYPYREEEFSYVFALRDPGHCEVYPIKEYLINNDQPDRGKLDTASLEIQIKNGGKSISLEKRLGIDFSVKCSNVGQHRYPVLAYGSNASPEQLFRKFSQARELGEISEDLTVIPVIKIEISNYDVVYTAGMAGYGSIPATIVPSLEVSSLQTYITYLTHEQLEYMHKTENNYYFADLINIEGKLDSTASIDCDRKLNKIYAYVAEAGPLLSMAKPVPIATRSPQKKALTQKEILQRAIKKVGFRGSLEEFVHKCTSVEKFRRNIVRRLQKSFVYDLSSNSLDNFQNFYFLPSKIYKTDYVGKVEGQSIHKKQLNRKKIKFGHNAPIIYVSSRARKTFRLKDYTVISRPNNKNERPEDFLAIARIVEDPSLENIYEFRMDQSLRNSLGIFDAGEGPYVYSIRLLPLKNAKTLFFTKLDSTKKMLLFRVYPARYTDMEMPIVRVPEDAHDLLSVDASGYVNLYFPKKEGNEYSLKKHTLQVLPLSESEKDLHIKNTQIERAHSPGKPFSDFSKSGISKDLSPIFIDGDARDILGCKEHQCILVKRDVPLFVIRRITTIIIASAVATYTLNEALGSNDINYTYLIIWILVTIIIICVEVQYDIKSKV